MKLDILVIASHPDDAELCCGGTIISHVKQGKKVGIIDLTQGELGTRGTAEGRLQEAQDAAKIMGVSVRENLKMQDGFFRNDREHQLQIMRKIRQYRPEIVITNAPSDRHPDHGRASRLVQEAQFLAGLEKIATELEGQPQEKWRPNNLFHFIQFFEIEPDFVVDVSEHLEQKFDAIRAYKSQFHNPESDEPETILTSNSFLEQMRARNLNTGFNSLVYAAEGFIAHKRPAVKSLFDLL